jgi:MoaA/NifB/PqqE/SkfB family radical SAM enzyme
MRGLSCYPLQVTLDTEEEALHGGAMKSAITSFLQSHTNKRLAKWEFKTGAKVVTSTPYTFTLETTTFCNLWCVICHHGNGAMPTRDYLDTAVIAKLSNFLSHAKRIQLHGIGEPLLSPSFWKILELLPRGQGIHITINSNGTVLTEERIDRLLNSPLTQISISLDAARAETYGKIRGTDFHRVIGNIRELVRRRNLGSSRRLTITINMTLMRENIQELPAFVDLAADLGVDGIAFWQMHDVDYANGWRTTKQEWKFTYEAQLLKHCPELANRMIQAALRRAHEKNVPAHYASI